MTNSPFKTSVTISVSVTHVRIEDDGIEELTEKADNYAYNARAMMGIGGEGDGLPCASHKITINNIQRTRSRLHPLLDDLTAEAVIEWNFYFG